MLLVQIFNNLYVSYAWECVDVHVDLQINCPLLLSKYKVAVKLIYIRTNKNQFSSSQVVKCGRTDIHGKANRWIFTTYCEYARIRRGHIYYLPLRHNWVSNVHNDDCGADDNDGGCENLFLQKPPIIFTHTHLQNHVYTKLNIEGWKTW